MVALHGCHLNLVPSSNGRIDGYHRYLLRGSPLLLCTEKMDV